MADESSFKEILPSATATALFKDVPGIGDLPAKAIGFSGELTCPTHNIPDPPLVYSWSVKNDWMTSDTSIGGLPVGRFSLMPGKNFLTLEVKTQAGEQLYSQTVELNGVGEMVKDLGIYFMLEGPPKVTQRYASILPEITQAAAKTNTVLPPEYQARVLGVKWADGEPPNGWFSQEIPQISINSAIFALGRDATVDAFTHELAHATYQWFKSTKPEYEARMLDVFKRVQQKELFGLLDESSYGAYSEKFAAAYPGIDFGHPYSDPGELFASASSCLQRYPDKFIAAIKQLGPEDKALMQEVVNLVVSGYERIPQGSPFIEGGSTVRPFFGRGVLYFAGTLTDFSKGEVQPSKPQQAQKPKTGQPA